VAVALVADDRGRWQDDRRRHWPFPATPAIPPPSRGRSGSAAPDEGLSTMKPGIHPEYHEINVIMTDGTQFKTRSCYGKPGESLRLDIDPKSHPAWTGQHRIIDTGGQVAKFNKKFAGLGLKR
jgi:large subunit ribosomal protein L31